MATVTTTTPVSGGSYSIAAGTMAVECTTTGDVNLVVAELVPGPAMVHLTEGPAGTWTGSLDLSTILAPGENTFKAIAMHGSSQVASDSFPVNITA